MAKPFGAGRSQRWSRRGRGGFGAPGHRVREPLLEGSWCLGIRSPAWSSATWAALGSWGPHQVTRGWIGGCKHSTASSTDGWIPSMSTPSHACRRNTRTELSPFSHPTFLSASSSSFFHTHSLFVFKPLFLYKSLATLSPTSRSRDSFSFNTLACRTHLFFLSIV